LPNYSEQEEKELLQNIAEGDELAFRRIFSSYSHIILPFLIKLVKSQSVAEELTQEVFLKVWINRDQQVQKQHLKKEKWSAL
jgi:DNA-directed RNA polymerase specialized sigma24 family protein